MLALIVKLIWADTEIFSQAEIFKIFEGFVFTILNFIRNCNMFSPRDQNFENYDLIIKLIFLLLTTSSFIFSSTIVLICHLVILAARGGGRDDFLYNLYKLDFE